MWNYLHVPSVTHAVVLAGWVLLSHSWTDVTLPNSPCSLCTTVTHIQCALSFDYVQRQIYWGRKPSRFCGCSRKFSLWILEVWHPLAWHKQAIRESFLRENHIFHQFVKVFSLESFPLYSNCWRCIWNKLLLVWGWMKCYSSLNALQIHWVLLFPGKLLVSVLCVHNTSRDILPTHKIINTQNDGRHTDNVGASTMYRRTLLLVLAV